MIPSCFAIALHVLLAVYFYVSPISMALGTDNGVYELLADLGFTPRVTTGIELRLHAALIYRLIPDTFNGNFFCSHNSHDVTFRDIV
jgi:hypothetical protein